MEGLGNVESSSSLNFVSFERLFQASNLGLCQPIELSKLLFAITHVLGNEEPEKCGLLCISTNLEEASEESVAVFNEIRDFYCSGLNGSLLYESPPESAESEIRNRMMQIFANIPGAMLFVLKLYRMHRRHEYNPVDEKRVFGEDIVTRLDQEFPAEIVKQLILPECFDTDYNAPQITCDVKNANPSSDMSYKRYKTSVEVRQELDIKQKSLSEVKERKNDSDSTLINLKRKLDVVEGDLEELSKEQALIEAKEQCLLNAETLFGSSISAFSRLRGMMDVFRSVRLGKMALEDFEESVKKFHHEATIESEEEASKHRGKTADLGPILNEDLGLTEDSDSD